VRLSRGPGVRPAHAALTRAGALEASACAAARFRTSPDVQRLACALAANLAAAPPLLLRMHARPGAAAERCVGAAVAALASFPDDARAAAAAAAALWALALAHGGAAQALALRAGAAPLLLDVLRRHALSADAVANAAGALAVLGAATSPGDAGDAAAAEAADAAWAQRADARAALARHGGAAALFGPGFAALAPWAAPDDAAATAAVALAAAAQQQMQRPREALRRSVAAEPRPERPPSVAASIWSLAGAPAPAPRSDFDAESEDGYGSSVR
jgi:hypothetical protein